MPHSDKGGGGGDPGLKTRHAARLWVLHGRRVLCPQRFEGYHRRRTARRRHELAEVLPVVRMREGVLPQGADVRRLRRYGQTDSIHLD